MEDTDSRPSSDGAGLALLILVLLAFLAAALIFFGSGWLQVDVGGAPAPGPLGF